MNSMRHLMHLLRHVGTAVLIAGLCPRAGLSQSRSPVDVPAVYKSTRDQVGHELVKTEQFVVPVGTPVVVSGLEFDSAGCSLSAEQKRILAQVFNALEEITENTVNDTDLERVARFKQMKFEVRGYSTLIRNRRKDAALSQQCAEVVMNYILSLGTPRDHLEAAGLGHATPAARKTAPKSPRHPLIVEFFRTK